MNISVKGVVYHEGKILLLKPAKDINSLNGWDGPGGKVDEGETLEEALKREVAEETGINVEMVQLLTEIKFPNNPILYVVSVCKADRMEVVLSSEHIDYRWVTIDEFYQLTKIDLRGLLNRARGLLPQL